MAFNVSATGYSGEVLEQLLVRATTGNELVDGGHIHIQPNVKKKLTLPRLRTGKMLQRRVEMPSMDGSTSLGDFNYDEKYLEPQDFMAYTEFNPRVFESIWRPFQPTGALVFRQLPPNVQNVMLAEMAKVVDFELGELYLTGTKGTGAKDFFDGILTRITADTDVAQVINAGIIAETNILDVLKAIRRNVPKSLRNNPNLKVFMSIEDADTYDYVLTERPYKGVDYSNMSPERFKGIQLVPLAAMPKDVMFCCVGTAGMDSNLWAGVDWSDDEDVIQIDKLQNNGEKYFFKMLMKADTNTVYGEDIVLFDGRDATALYNPATDVVSDPANAAAGVIDLTMNQGDLLTLIAETTDVALLQNALAAEKATKHPRKAVIDAINAQIASLS